MNKYGLQFPFDEQLCFLKFGSWTYDGVKLDLQVSLCGSSARSVLNCLRTLTGVGMGSVHLHREWGVEDPR